MREGLSSSGRQLPSHLVFRKFLVVSALSYVQFIAAGIPACCQPPGGGGGGSTIPTIYGDPNSPPSTLIAGTHFPWRDRRGNVAYTFSGHFQAQLNGAFVPGVTVKFMGKDCTITSPGTAPNYYTEFSYLGDPVAVSGDASTPWHWHIDLFYNSNPIPKTPYRGTWEGDAQIYTVESHDPPNPIDSVQSLTRLFYQNPDAVNGQADANSAPPRQVRTGFLVTAPVAYGNSFSMISVGLVQTLTEMSDAGSVSYHSGASVVNVPYTMNPGFSWPMYDQAGLSIKPFYSFAAMMTGGQGQGYTFLGPNGYTWFTANSSTLNLIDSPSQQYSSLVDNHLVPYSWGTLPFGSLTQSRGGSPSVDDFEVALCATCSACPGIYVPIRYFKHWRQIFDGSVFSLPFGYWIGGSVMDLGLSVGQPETTVGPPNGNVNLGPIIH